MNRLYRVVIRVAAIGSVGTLIGALSGGCQHKMSAEEEKAAVASFRGGPQPADEAKVQAQEQATAAAYRKAHPEKFPTDIKR